MCIPNVCPPSSFIFHMMSLVHRLGPNDHSSSASSQHILTTSDSMRAVVPMMADTKLVRSLVFSLHKYNSSSVVLWMPNSPSSRNAILHGSPYNSPTPHDLGGAGSRTSSHPATGRVYLSPRSFPMYVFHHFCSHNRPHTQTQTRADRSHFAHVLTMQYDHLGYALRCPYDGKSQVIALLFFLT